MEGSSICLERVRKTTRILSQDSVLADLNWLVSEYKSEALLLGPCRLVSMFNDNCDEIRNHLEVRLVWSPLGHLSVHVYYSEIMGLILTAVINVMIKKKMIISQCDHNQ
jgi:hypothetical protein